MAIREFAVLKNRTEAPVTFTYGGQQETIKAGGTLTVDLELTKFLFTCDQVLGLTLDPETGEKKPVFKVGIQEGPDTLLETLEAECFNTDSITVIPSPEHPDLAASRAVQIKKVATDPSDYRTGLVAVR